MLRGWPTDEILRFANAAAAVSCTRLGALGGIPSLEEVEAQVGYGNGKDVAGCLTACLCLMC